MQISLRCNEVEADVASLEASFRDLLLRGAEALVSKLDPANGTCLRLGCLVLLMIDSSWGWLGKDGRVERINSRYVALHPKVSLLAPTCLSIWKFLTVLCVATDLDSIQ
jgi:hypothetical protein